ncbi:MAG: HEAT repeat domain-containing protein [Chloroflexota bacterium]
MQQFRRSKNEDTFFALIHLDESQVHDLIKAYLAETRVDIKALLVEIISHYKQPTSLNFLASALQAAHPQVWKNALDGIVSIGGKISIQILEEEKQRLASEKRFGERIEWIEEALQQLRGIIW